MFGAALAAHKNEAGKSVIEAVRRGHESGHDRHHPCKARKAASSTFPSQHTSVAGHGSPLSLVAGARPHHAPHRRPRRPTPYPSFRRRANRRPHHPNAARQPQPQELENRSLAAGPFFTSRCRRRVRAMRKIEGIGEANPAPCSPPPAKLRRAWRLTVQAEPGRRRHLLTRFRA